MMHKRIVAILFSAFAALTATAENSLLPGSIDFNQPALWGREVIYGLDDNGNYSGASRWYVDHGASGATIRRHVGKTTGYLQTVYGTSVHRTMSALKPREAEGPDVSSGQNITESGIYIDSVVSLSAYTDQTTPRIFSPKDKINCWICIPDSTGGAVTNFIITAGSTNGVVNYVTDAKVAPGENFRLMIRAAYIGDVFGFEVFVNGRQVRSGSTTVFPSMLSENSVYASKLYSFGVTGVATAENINFTKVDPREDPNYDKDDVSMLRESAEISVSGFVSASGLVDFPLLVRVSEERIKGFLYSRTSVRGDDICFTDENGKVIPHEVDTWNPGGESLVWVKVPYLSTGTKIRMHWSLRQGYVAPDNDSESVWSDYIAVWHFSDAEKGYAKDSSGHGFFAAMTEGGTLSVAEVPAIGVAGAVAGGKLQCVDYEKAFPVNGNFTFTGWYMAKDITAFGNASSALFGKKVGGDRAQDSEGWCGLAWSSTSLRFYGDGDSYRECAQLPDVRANWLHAALVYSNGGFAEAFANGERKSEGTMAISATTNLFTLAAAGALADEIRISRKVRSAEWIQAEYEQAHIDTYVSYSPAIVKDDDNYWVEEPYVRPNSVEVSAADTLEVYAGKPRFGASILIYVDAAGNESFDKPTAAGTYKAIAYVKPGARQGLRREMPFVIYEKRAYQHLAGYDRVMLFNSDESPKCPVGLQGYYDIDSKLQEVWYHDDAPWTGLLPYVLDGENHVYYEADTHRKLWEFRHARIGNLFPDISTLENRMNYLPWGGFAKRLEDSESRADNQCFAGMLILQNRSTALDTKDPAAAYSPCYKDGVGTVYFDAVNAYCGYRNTLKVQVCGTDDADVADGAWRDVEADVFAIRDGVYDPSMSTNGVIDIVLNMNKDVGTTNWFYRIRATIDTNAAARVRIIRTDNDFGEGEDDEGMVLIDNIIVSPPAMGVRLLQFGAPADPDNLVLRGQRAPFDIAFPSAADLGNLHALVKVDYIANNTNEIDSSFIGSMNFRYRWRYLNQIVGDWQDLLMLPDDSDPCKFASPDVITGEGVGDIEYNCEAVVNAPFYDYWDYSGMVGWLWPDGYSERRGNVMISAEKDGVYGFDHLSPALGVDYFVRLREGKSDYEGFRLHVKRTNGGVDDKSAKEEIVDMSLSSDNTWRGFYQTITNQLTNVYYRVEAINRQTATGCDYQWTTNWFHGINQLDIPTYDVMVEGDGWARLPCDELTGFIMFQLEDTTRSMSIIHADYQDFNAWTDARLDSGSFVGTSTALPTSGVSRTVRSFTDDLGLFHASISSNSLWTERFILTGSEVVSTEGKYAVDIPFKGEKKETPNGWSAESGMWVCESFRELGGKSFALQLLSESSGRLTMNRQKAPHGIESISYSARIAQSYLSNPFNYFTGTTNDVYRMTDYTFAVPCAMTTATNDNFTGVGTVSVVAHYRDSRGGYEARLERIASKTLQLSLYKWSDNGTATLIGSSPQTYTYGEGIGMDAHNRKFGALFISCTNTPTSVRIMAGVMATSKEFLDDSFRLSEANYYKICYEDTSDDRFTSGTFGVGSKDCPATFALPKLTYSAVDWDTAIKGTTKIGAIYYSKSAAKVSFPNERALINYGEDYDNWNIYRRLPRKSFSGDMPYGIYGFKANLPAQYVVAEVATAGKEDWRPISTNYIDSFCFSRYVQNLYVCDDLDVRLKVGGDYGAPDVVLDDIEVLQWRGQNYDDSDITIDIPSGQINYGAPTNFVFTTAWIHDGVSVEISPMRTFATTPSGLRSPLMDGSSDRGLGLGSFSFAYSNANPHARLIVQIATNGVDITTLTQRTREMSGWTDVALYDFSEKTPEELASGLIATYIGLHGVKGLARVIVDPSLVAEAHDPLRNPDNDPEYGRVFLVSAGAKDNPVLDSGCWWGWNLRTTDEEARQLLKDGDLDIRLNGMSYALNNSIVNDIRLGDVYDLHKPFLQTPILTRGAIGEVTFKARKYAASDPSPSVAVYGMKAYNPEAKDAEFEFLTNIVINSEQFRTYTYQAPVSDNYTCFRLAVTGVEGIIGDGSAYTPDDPPEGPMPESGRVRRVLLDEVAVFEAIKARMGFFNVGVFRNHLGDNDPVPNVPSRSEQPLCHESWGVQTELYAVRLSERIDYSRAPKVILHWYDRTSPWGYDKWCTNAAAHTAVMSKAEGTNLIYRSSYIASPDAVVPMSDTPGSIIQYSLEVEYYMEGQSVPLTNVLTASDWVCPEWYNPVNYNETLGRGTSFSAFNILDEVAPGWAWINEINLFGERVNYANSDIDNQYIEVAAPAEASLDGWYLRLIVPEQTSDAVITNKLVTFGRDGLPDKKSIGSASNMVFHVVGSPETSKAGRLKPADGTLDGVWSCDYPSTAFDTDGTIQYYQGLGFQLVRRSGVVEHELVAIGTNLFATSSNRSNYHPTNVVAYLNRMMPRSDFFYAGDDDGGRGNSLGVFDSFGESSNYWNKTMIETPGRINVNQNIWPDHPVPYGSSITVFANLIGDHILQTTGEAVKTNLNQILIVRKGSDAGTNITYFIDEWYELADVGVTEGGPVWTYEPSQRQVTVTVAKGCSNNTLTVSARAQVDKRLRDLGCTEENRYTPAIIDWLGKRSFMKDVYGTGMEWPYSDGNIYLADFMGINRQVVTNMTLTEMYWLDICPTISNQCLVAGMVKPPMPDTSKPKPGYEGEAWLTNVNMTVFMMISNRTEDTESPYYGKAWAPYVLRGLDPGVTSWDYAKEGVTWGWTNVNFKITGILANGLTSEHKIENWVPLRYFVFKDGSFDENFQTRVEVPEPHSPRSLGYMSGWSEWFRMYPDDDSPIFFSWAIDTRMIPVDVEILQPENDCK